MAVTQKQIAERLNVSRALVGRALNGADEVSDVMRERVLEVAREMGYDTNSNQMARSLIARRYGQRVKTGIIGLTFPAEDVISPRNVPFYAPFLQGMEDEAIEHSCDLCLCLMRGEETPRLLRGQGVDGVVTLTTLDTHMKALLGLDVPIVTYQARRDEAHSVGGDDRRGGYLATRHLLELGHREIAFLGVDLPQQGGEIVEKRRLGYEDALAEFGIALREEWLDCSLPLPQTSARAYCSGCGRCAACIGWDVLKKKSGVDGAGQLPFTAVVCHHDPIAMGVVDAARRDGLETPRDLSVVGFDFSQEYGFQPAITSIAYPSYEMGREVVRLIYELQSADNTVSSADYQHRVFPATLHVRESSAPPRRAGL